MANPIPENPNELEMRIGVCANQKRYTVACVLSEQGSADVDVQVRAFYEETRGSEQISLQRMTAIDVQKCPNNLRFHKG